MRFSALAALALLAAGLPARAAPPTITAAQGTLASGQVLTVSGTNLIDEDTSNWQPFFRQHADASSFEGTSPAADGWPQPGNRFDSVYAPDGLLGQQSALCHVQGASTNCPTDNLGNYFTYLNDSGCEGDIWMRLYVRWNLKGGAWPTSHIKMLDVMGSGPCTGAPQWYFQPAVAGGATPSQMTCVYDGANHTAAIPGGPLQENRWYSVEVHMSNVGGNRFQAWMDGQQLCDETPLGRPGLLYVMVGLINACGTTADFELEHSIDGFVVSSSRVYPASTIEISNSTSYASGWKKLQEPLALGDSSAQVKLDLEGAGAGPYYLWVTNNRQERAGPFLLGGTVDPDLRPAPPSNLRLQ